MRSAVVVRSFLFAILCVGGARASDSSVDFRSVDEMRNAKPSSLQQSVDHLPVEFTRTRDNMLFRSAYASGGDLFQQFVRFLFPTTGREKRVMFLPTPYWDPKKPRTHKIKWQRFESDHFDFYAYPESQQTLPSVMKYYEEEYVRNNRVFGVDSKFTKKIPIIFYQTRRDFEQTAIVDGPIPEGLGGLTEIFGWRRVTFPFEGEWSKFEHVAKHEGTHVFQIAKKAKRLPLWFVEGSAETNSIYWDSDAEMIVRDAFLNGFFLHIRDLWQIEGTWLMYKIGNFICNVIWDEYGEEGYRKIMDNASKKSFENNLQESLGITLEELDQKVHAILQQRYSFLLRRDDILKESKEIQSQKIILASRGRFFVSGGLQGPRNSLYINYLSADGQLTFQDIAQDKVFNNESLENFDKGVALTDSLIVYAMKKSGGDEIRIIPYSFDVKKKKFDLSDEQAYGWKGIDRIQNPVIIDKQHVAFIGYQDGFSNIYIGDLTNQGLEKITSGQKHYIDLDYSPITKKLVYSLEGERDPKRVFYNRDLQIMDLDTRFVKNLTSSEKIIEIQPKFSSDGKKILFVATPDLTYDLMVYDLENNSTQRLTTMNIGAKNPQWGMDDSILFNGFKQGAPTIYQFAIPTLKKIIQKNRPSFMQKEKFVLQDDQVVVPTATKIEVPHEELVLNELYVVDQTPVIRNSDRNYSAKSIATLEKKLVVKTSEGLPGDKQTKHEYLPHYFELQGSNIQSLKSSMVAEDGISDDIRKWASLKLSGRDIVQSWMSQDHKKALLIVNNRLAKDYESFNKKPEVSLLIYDGAENHVDELEKAPIKKLSETVQWVAFLKNDKIFMALGEERTGPFEIYIYDSKNKSYEELDREVIQFRISNDYAKILYKGIGYSLIDFSSGDKPKPTVLADVPDGTLAAEFNLDNNPTFFSYNRHDKKWIFTTYVTGEKKYSAKEFLRKAEESVDRAAISASGNVAVIAMPKDKDHQEEMWIWNPVQKQPFMLNTIGDDFSNIIFRKDYLTFFSSYHDARASKEYAWSPELNDKVIELDRVQTAKLEDEFLFYEGQHLLCSYDRDDGRAELIEADTMGYSIQEGEMLYSSREGEHYQISRYDLDSKSKKKLTSTDYDKFNPTFKGKDIAYIVQKNGEWSIETQNEKSGKTQEITSANYNFTDLKNLNGQWQVEAQPKRKEYSIGPEHPSQPDYPTLLQPRPARQNIRLQNLAAAVAYDGDALRYFFSGYADNLFSDKGVFASAMFLDDTKFASVGFSDLNSGKNASFFYNQRDGIQNMGIDLSKNFIFDRYRQLTPYVDFEYQSYSNDSSRLNSFIDSSFNDRRYYLAKFGTIYAYDVSVWDRHGPASGARLYFRTETGIDMGNSRRSNTDGNIDIRIYNRILPRLGFATRLSGGTSQGPIPNIYLLGGNMSFRGVGFDDLIGQNYWVFSEDLRLPMFDFIGAKFFDPLDSFLGLFSRYFDVRAGVYADLGSTWMNNQDPDFIYSVGYFVNIPTVFGLIVRLNQGLAGKKNFGLWFGANW